MNHETTNSLRDAACLDLPVEVNDKYFTASARTQPFEYLTAQAICRQCPAQLPCLEDAISSPAVFTGSSELIRGGESGAAIQAMRRKHFLEGVPAKRLAAMAIRQQACAPSVGSHQRLRSGRFPDAVLATESESADGR